MKYVGWIVLALVVLFGVEWLATGNEFFLYKFFAPKTESVRRQI